MEKESGRGTVPARCASDSSALHQKLVDFCSNVTVYAPGEGERVHNHPSSEELRYVISGSGVIQDMEQNVKAHIDQGKLILIDRGEIHRIFNDGRAPLIVLLVCTAHTPMPEG